MFICRDSKEGGKLVSYSTASLGIRGTLRNRVGGGSSEEKKQAEYLAPGKRRNIVHRGVGPGQRSGLVWKRLEVPMGPPDIFYQYIWALVDPIFSELLEEDSEKHSHLDWNWRGSGQLTRSLRDTLFLKVSVYTTTLSASSFPSLNCLFSFDFGYKLRALISLLFSSFLKIRVESMFG